MIHCYISLEEMMNDELLWKNDDFFLLITLRIDDNYRVKGAVLKVLLFISPSFSMLRKAKDVRKHQKSKKCDYEKFYFKSNAR